MSDFLRVVFHSLSLTAVQLITPFQTVPLEVAFESLWQRPVVRTQDALANYVHSVCCNMNENVG